MAFRINLDTDNAAFTEDGSEVARLLRKVADDIDNGGRDGSLRDINGNRVGSWEYEWDGEEEAEELDTSTAHCRVCGTNGTCEDCVNA